MTREEIIEMSNQAQLCQCIWIDDEGPEIASLVAFAKLIAAKAFPDGVDAEWIARRTKYAVEQEREACAKVCEEVGEHPSLTPLHCAESIRARGEA